MFNVHINICELDAALAITGDRKRSFFSSSYHDAFQYRWPSPPPSTETVEFQVHFSTINRDNVPYVITFHSSLVMRDKDKISEHETTHSASLLTDSDDDVCLGEELGLHSCSESLISHLCLTCAHAASSWGKHSSSSLFESFFMELPCAWLCKFALFVSYLRLCLFTFNFWWIIHSISVYLICGTGNMLYYLIYKTHGLLELVVYLVYLCFIVSWLL